MDAMKEICDHKSDMVDHQADTLYHTITNRLHIQSAGLLQEKLRGGMTVRGFWGTAPTGRPHIGYLIPLVKIAECIRSGVDVIILIADSYAFLVNHDTTFEVVNFRAEYYSRLIKAVLKALGVPSSDIRIVVESSYSMTEDFQRMYMALAAATSLEDLKMVSTEVAETKVLSTLLCPLHQAVSEVQLKSDFQLGGLDQRGVFAYADRHLPAIGYQSNAHLMNPMLPSLLSGKMSSSASLATKVMFLDSEDEVARKLAECSLDDKDVEQNFLLAALKHIVFPMHGILSGNSHPVTIELLNGDARHYTTFEELYGDVKAELVVPVSLRSVVGDNVNSILRSIRRDYDNDPSWAHIESIAYSQMEF